MGMEFKPANFLEFLKEKQIYGFGVSFKELKKHLKKNVDAFDAYIMLGRDNEGFHLYLMEVSENQYCETKLDVTMLYKGPDFDNLKDLDEQSRNPAQISKEALVRKLFNFFAVYGAASTGVGSLAASYAYEVYEVYQAINGITSQEADTDKFCELQEIADLAYGAVFNNDQKDVKNIKCKLSEKFKDLDEKKKLSVLTTTTRKATCAGIGAERLKGFKLNDGDVTGILHAHDEETINVYFGVDENDDNKPEFPCLIFQVEEGGDEKKNKTSSSKKAANSDTSIYTYYDITGACPPLCPKI